MEKRYRKIMLAAMVIIGLGIVLVLSVNSFTVFQAKASQTNSLIKNIGKTEEGLPLYDYTEYNRDQLMKCIILTEAKGNEAFKKFDDKESNKWLEARWQCFETYVNLPPVSVQDPLPIGEYNEKTNTFEFTHFD